MGSYKFYLKFVYSGQALDSPTCVNSSPDSVKFYTPINSIHSNESSPSFKMSSRISLREVKNVLPSTAKMVSCGRKLMLIISELNSHR